MHRQEIQVTLIAQSPDSLGWLTLLRSIELFAAEECKALLTLQKDRKYVETVGINTV